MAVTITIAAMASAIGVEAGDAKVARLHPVVVELVTRYAPAAPDAVANEAAIRTAAYMAADDPALRTLRSLKVADGALDIEPRAAGAAVRLSGAAALLSSWRVRRAPHVKDAT